MILTPGHGSLADWRAVHAETATPRLDPACRAAVEAGAAAVASAQTDAPPVPRFRFEEATVADLQDAMRAGRLSAGELTQAYLERIAAVDVPGGGRPGTAAVIELNPDALAEAAASDARRAARHSLGPLDGIPAGMPSLARAAKVASRLGRAGQGDAHPCQDNPRRFAPCPPPSPPCPTSTASATPGCCR